MNTGDERPEMNEVSRMCTRDRLNPAGAGAVVRRGAGAGFFEGVRLGVGLGVGVGVGVGVEDADALGDVDADGVGFDSGFLCEHAPSVSPAAHRMAMSRTGTVRGFIALVLPAL
jgi:hypothetical protein